MSGRMGELPPHASYEYNREQQSAGDVAELTRDDLAEDSTAHAHPLPVGSDITLQ